MNKEINTKKNLKVNPWKSLLEGLISINDLREKELNGELLSIKEKEALNNFNQYRISILNNQESEELFQKKYQEFQTMANLNSYEEFLKPEYLLQK